MTNIEKYRNAFKETFGITDGDLNDDFSRESVADWDSVHQLNITMQLEDSFDIMFDPEDIMEFTSFRKGKEILKKYDIDIDL